MCGTTVWEFVTTRFGLLIRTLGGSSHEQQQQLVQSEASNMTLTGKIIVQKKHTLDLTDVGADIIDDAADILGFKVRFQLISESTDPVSGSGKRSKEVSVGGWFLSLDGVSAGDVEYKVSFSVDKEFGIPGAFIVKNHHANKFFLKSFTLHRPDNTETSFVCNSWIHNTSKYSNDRVFFRNQVYLPQNTPNGVKDLREKELSSLRGDGKGVRKSGERIYDYDVYNDLGNPDKGKDLARPVLGGSKLPYPRRVRTGRKPSNADKDSESVPVDDMYLPEDEEMGKVRYSSFLGDSLKAAAHKLVPAIKKFYASETPSFVSFKEVKSLYDNGIELGDCVTPETDEQAKKQSVSPFTLINELTVDDETNNNLLRYPLPQVIAKDEDAWMSDDEFARQSIAGLNPLVIQILEAYPPTSNLDTTVFGTQASALTVTHIEKQLEGLTVQQALEAKRLYILDFHDVFLPYLNKINDQKGSKMYASRTILFLTDKGTLKIVAIELSLPGDKTQRNNRVFLPPSTKKDWLWELAKAHVAVNDTGYHQLVSHWMKTHAIMEPIIIATHRQLSAIHPVHLLLLPHFKNTMAINSRARKGLINSKGIIEENFTTGKYSMEMSAVVYDLLWRFDQEGLPQDLIRRGIAVPNPNAEHGLELRINDYPYANDGLDIWAAIKGWVEEYVAIFYVDDEAVTSDPELRSWWSEIRNVGHADKKNENWWSNLSTKKELEEVLTTIIWVASAHHAAVNFGQYAYAGYSPNRPTAAHKYIPEEGSPEFHELQANPEKFYLSAISSKIEAATVMTTIEILSTHAADEEYLGERKTENWTSNQNVLDAFDRFAKRALDVEKNVMRRNKDANLKNRHGPANVAYTLLCINSRPGLTGRGVPNSISI